MTAPDDTLPALDDAGLDAALEALLLVVDAPTDEEQLASALEQPVERVRAALLRLSDGYAAAGRGIDLRRTGGGWRFYTRDAYAPYVERFLLDGQRARLTRAALETLAVVAYRQPVTRARVSRGARRQLRRRAAHAAHPRAHPRGRHRTGDSRAPCSPPPSCSWSGWASPRSRSSRRWPRCFPTSTRSTSCEVI